MLVGENLIYVGKKTICFNFTLQRGDVVLWCRFHISDPKKGTYFVAADNIIDAASIALVKHGGFKSVTEYAFGSGTISLVVPAGTITIHAD